MTWAARHREGRDHRIHALRIRARRGVVRPHLGTVSPGVSSGATLADRPGGEARIRPGARVAQPQASLRCRRGLDPHRGRAPGRLLAAESWCRAIDAPTCSRRPSGCGTAGRSWARHRRRLYAWLLRASAVECTHSPLNLAVSRSDCSRSTGHARPLRHPRPGARWRRSLRRAAT